MIHCQQYTLSIISLIYINVTLESSVVWGEMLLTAMRVKNHAQNESLDLMREYMTKNYDLDGKLSLSESKTYVARFPDA